MTIYSVSRVRVTAGVWISKETKCQTRESEENLFAHLRVCFFLVLFVSELDTVIECYVKSLCDKSFLLDSAPRSSCEREIQRATGEGQVVVSSGFSPECSPDGRYADVQCDFDTCFCSDGYGYEIPGTRRNTSAGRPDCTKMPGMSFQPKIGHLPNFKWDH